MILPETARTNAAGHLEIGGCDTVELARRYGTPLYVFDEKTLRERCQGYIREFSERYPRVQVAYASKAFINVGLARCLNALGMAFDVVSGGEIYVLRKAGVAMANVHFHGNNKTEEELREALELGVGRIVVDGFDELELLDRLTRERAGRQRILLRCSPGVSAHTHDYLRTGALDSKFGIPIQTGDAEEAVTAAMHSPGLELAGVHAHIGSQIFDLEPYQDNVDILFGFAASMHSKHRMRLEEFSPGGGFGIQYTDEDDPKSLAEVAEAITQAVQRAAGRHGLEPPLLILEPGRSVVGQAGVALYTVGARKQIPGVRTYVSVDGGMADNIRPAIYGAKYTALSANRPDAAGEEVVTIAGKYCESGDILISDINLPRLGRGEILAIPASGAYCLSMASNYNLAPRPAIVLVQDGQARLWRRRETYEDMVQLDEVDLDA